MTKKETAIFNKFYEEALSAYMAYAMKGEFSPDDVFGRVCVLTELRESLFPKDNTEAGA